VQQIPTWDSLKKAMLMGLKHNFYWIKLIINSLKYQVKTLIVFLDTSLGPFLILFWDWGYPVFNSVYIFVLLLVQKLYSIYEWIYGWGFPYVDWIWKKLYPIYLWIFNWGFPYVDWIWKKLYPIYLWIYNWVFPYVDWSGKNLYQIYLWIYNWVFPYVDWSRKNLYQIYLWFEENISDAEVKSAPFVSEKKEFVDLTNLDLEKKSERIWVWTLLGAFLIGGVYFWLKK
jgi:hypothetical protein